MKESAPEWGAGSDEPTGRLCFRKVGPSDGHRGRCVRTGSSYAVPIEFSPTSTGASRSQSERGLDLAERSPEGEPEARASGKSERSERNDGGGRGDHALIGGCCDE